MKVLKWAVVLLTAVLGLMAGAPALAMAGGWRTVRVQNVVIDLGTVAFVGIGVVIGY